jgi:cellulose synthase/poly-beta-1,6-N-acetylglucosamine synthase-like glycosyltransferase
MAPLLKLRIKPYQPFQEFSTPLRFLSQDPPDVVVFIDADCVVAPDAFEHLVQTAVSTRRPVQSNYLIERPAETTAKDAFSAFSIKLKNFIRPKGLTYLGYPCLLTGSGIAFPWSVITSVSLASSHLVEDMKLGLDLAIAEHPPTFCEQALVLGTLPTSQDGAKNQRTRWVHGELKTLREYLPKLLSAAVQQKRFDLLVQAIDLSASPIVLVFIIWTTLIVFSILFIGISGIFLPAIFLVISGLLIATAIIISWIWFGRTELSSIEFLSLPFYIAWKIPIYFAFFLRKQTEWIRTSRS